MDHINSKKGEVTYKGKTYQLTKTELNILLELNKHDIVTLKDLYNVIYKTNVKELSEYDKKMVYVHVCRLRKRVDQAIKIESKSEFGYYLKEKIGGTNE